MGWKSVAVGCLLAAAGGSSLNAGKRINLVGCPRAGIETNCLILKGPGNVAYDISAATPRPRLSYRAVQLSGTRSHKLGICQQGAILEDIQWSYTKQKCD